MSKRILIIDNSLYVTGALKSVVASSTELSDEFEFLFVLPKASLASPWVESRGFKAYELPFLELSRKPMSFLLYLPTLLKNGLLLKKLIRDKNIELVHGNDLYNLAIFAASISGSVVPFVTHIRFLPDKFPQLLFRLWLWLHFRFARRVIAVSYFQANRLPANRKLTMIYDKLPEDVMPSARKESDGARILLYISNTIPGKGLEYAVDVFSKLSKEFPEWRLRFVGGDMGLPKNRAYKDMLQARCQEVGIALKTEWSDFTDDVAAEYVAADIALNFSESESFSRTTVEALFFGCPIVATACGGPSEIVDHGRTGFLVPVGDVPLMVSSVRQLMKDDLLRARFSQEGQKSVRRKFAAENTSDKLRQVYKTVLLDSLSEKND